MPPKIPFESKKMMLKVYDYFVAESKRGAPFYSWKNSNKRATHCLNISLDSLRKILKVRDESKSMEFQENNKTFKKDSLDQFDKDVIKNVIYGYFSKNKCVTLRKLKVELDENHGIKLTKYKLWKTLHELGFRYKKLSGQRKALVERVDIVNQRINYLRTIKKKREEGFKPVYLDETWCDTNHTTSHQWAAEDDSKNRKLPLGKGQRFVILHAGCEDGFLNGCELVFKGISTDGRDYHTEMNSKIFEKWVNEQLEPALPEKSLIIMDNASYHSVREEGTKTPTSNSRKGDMINWLTKNNINFNNKAKKPELYEIVKLNKGPPIYKVDEFLKHKGHEVLRLPPYHCELNPIELIWGDLKGFVGRENSTFKGEDVKALIKKGFAQIDSVKWLHACEHVKHSIEQKFWK